MDSTNDRTTRKQYSMQFKLVNRRTKEVVDTLEVIKSEKDIAKEIFQRKKQLDNKSFEKLYEVMENKDDGDRPTRF
jgi:CRISPR/Cas system CSM-associated protein Csm2 small subunit